LRNTKDKHKKRKAKKTKPCTSHSGHTEDKAQKQRPCTTQWTHRRQSVKQRAKKNQLETQKTEQKRKKGEKTSLVRVVFLFSFLFTRKKPNLAPVTVVARPHHLVQEGVGTTGVLLAVAQSAQVSPVVYDVLLSASSQFECAAGRTVFWGVPR
jgi:hypothetical protein